MKAKLLVDLTKYNPLFKKDSICLCDGVPFRHPNIRWEDCYNLWIGDESLPVSKSGIEFLDESEDDENSELKNLFIKTRIEFTGQKIVLTEFLSKALAVYISKDDKGNVKKVRIFETRDEMYVFAQDRRCPFFSLEDEIADKLGQNWNKTFAQFVDEYTEEETSINRFVFTGYHTGFSARANGKEYDSSTDIAPQNSMVHFVDFIKRV